MRVLGVCSYPIEAAATRFRLDQYVEPLREHGIELAVRPFLDSSEFRKLYRKSGFGRLALSTALSVVRRFGDVVGAGSYDLLYVQREAMPFGPALSEWMFQRIVGLPIALDLDDATYVAYVSPRFGKVGSALKFFGKTDSLIRNASVVICGNRIIADHVRTLGTIAVVVPTIVDTEKFRPSERKNEVPVIGWIGTHSTLPSLQEILPVLQRLSEKHRFILRVVGAGSPINADGLEIQNKEWSLQSEVDDFNSIDIGLYPIFGSKSADSRWLAGKSGFKAIEYMAVGVPFVMSPVGVCAELGIPGETHYNADSPGDWYNSLDKLLEDEDLRRKMGAKGRQFSINSFGLEQHSKVLADTLKAVCLKKID